MEGGGEERGGNGIVECGIVWVGIDNAVAAAPPAQNYE